VKKRMQKILNADVDGNYMSYLLRFDILAHIFGNGQNVLEELGVLPLAVLVPKGVVYIMDHEVVPMSYGLFSHGHITCPHF
jgi:hypothetical protein